MTPNEKRQHLGAFYLVLYILTIVCITFFISSCKSSKKTVSKTENKKELIEKIDTTKTKETENDIVTIQDTSFFEELEEITIWEIEPKGQFEISKTGGFVGEAKAVKKQVVKKTKTQIKGNKKTTDKTKVKEEHGGKTTTDSKEETKKKEKDKEKKGLSIPFWVWIVVLVTIILILAWRYRKIILPGMFH